MNRPTPFNEAFRDVTGLDPTPTAVTEVLLDPAIRKAIAEQEQTIIEMRDTEEEE